MLDFVLSWWRETWQLLADAAVYVLFGLLVGGLLKTFLSPATVVRHLGRGRYLSVIKAALLGIPMPLCSCGVLPAAASLKRQGANRGATTAFLISTPETGVDSLAITYALLGPLMTVARPVAAFVTATVAGFMENMISRPTEKHVEADLTCTVDGCCDGRDCPDAVHRRHHSALEKVRAGVGFAYGELWSELVGWFLVGMALAGLITTLVPDDALSDYLGGGLHSMLLMLAVGIPLYICATASTPIAASLILKGVSPGAALVFLLAGPATNITSLVVLVGVLGKRGTAIYLTALAVMSVVFGLLLDALLGWWGISLRAQLGQAADWVPGWLQTWGAVALLLLSVRPLWRRFRAFFRRARGIPGGGVPHSHCGCGEEEGTVCTESKGCCSQEKPHRVRKKHL